MNLWIPVVSLRSSGCRWRPPSCEFLQLLLVLCLVFVPIGIQRLVAEPSKETTAELQRLVAVATRTRLAKDAFAVGSFAASKDEIPDTPNYIGNFQIAVEWYEKAANMGHAEAAYELGELYFDGRYRETDPVGLQWFIRAHEARHPRAAARLAGIYWTSNGKIRGDVGESVKWSRIAWEAGDLDSAFRLSNIMFDPSLPYHDETEGHRLLVLAANGGHDAAQLRLLLLKRGDEKLSEDEISRFESMQDAWPNVEAHLMLARAYDYGRGTARDPSHAATHYRNVLGLLETKFLPASENTPSPLRQQLLLEASARLLAIYSEAKLTAPKRGEERRPFPFVPELFPTHAARYQLAENLWNGTGAFPTNRALAMDFYTYAAMAGSGLAMHRIGHFWASGANGKPDSIEASLWFVRGAQLGEPKCQVEAGRHLIDGIGIARDTVEGLKWLILAQKQGASGAKILLEQARRGSSAADQGEAERRAGQFRPRS